jgi:hypothetical protein
MTEQDVRALVQKVLAQRGVAPGGSMSSGGASHGGAPAGGIDVGGPLPGSGPRLSPLALYRNHASHATFSLQVTVGDDGHTPCVIEPGVACDHCGYCRSYGH